MDEESASTEPCNSSRRLRHYRPQQSEIAEISDRDLRWIYGYAIFVLCCVIGFCVIILVLIIIASHNI
eukprot:10325.XXX_124639_124842_1 [CDS] Oithona nana genome sequencing.